jgi:ATP-binding cassette, subfamily B, multidrug efflux pump
MTALPSQEEEALGKAYDGRLMRRLMAYVRPQRGRAMLAVGLIIVSSLLQLVGPLSTAIALDLFIHPPSAGEKLTGVSAWAADHWQPLPSPERGILIVAGFFLASLLLTFGIKFAQGYVMQMMGQLIQYDLRREIFGQLQRLPIRYFDKNPVGRLVTRVTTDVDALNELFTSGLVSICGDLVLLAGIAVVLFALNWRLALVTFAILPLLFGLSVWFKARARYWFREVRTRVARINSFLQEHISGMTVVQLFTAEERAAAEFRDIADDHRVANVRGIFYYAVYYPQVELINALGLALIVWYGGGKVLASALSLGALIAFFQYAQRFYEPLADLSEKYNVLQAAMASSERIFRLLDTEVTLLPPVAPYRPSEVRGEIELDHVSFSYNPGEPVIEDLSFSIRAGEMIAVVGHTGAGKSTLANLLLRFYDVDAGAVKVDGVDVREWDLERLRESIGLVLQDVFLFAGTIGENIHLGAPQIDEERLRWAASEVRALPFVERLPHGFGTTVRERGAGLSVGQKQLISFARALAFDPKVLILDEATASIDTETEQLIQAALDRLLVGRTSLVIAHRLSTIQKADRILVMHKGRLRELGTHQELLAQRGIYYRLYQLQYRDEVAA